MTKKRAADSKSSEFKGGDLNKYTSRSYMIKDGNEIFGGQFNIAKKIIFDTVKLFKRFYKQSLFFCFSVCNFFLLQTFLNLRYSVEITN